MRTKLDDASWPELAELAPATVLVVPVGACEQHGPHLPLSTDSDIALALARELAASRPAVWVAPLLAYGSSGEHADFPGTLSIGARALELVLVELVRSASESFPRVLLISAHGGNRQALRSALALLESEGHDVRAFEPSWEGDAHAGRTETSLMLALDGDRVLIERAEAGERRPLGELIPQLRREGVRAVSANGVLGDPAGADPVQGRQLLAEALQQLVALLDEWAGQR